MRSEHLSPAARVRVCATASAQAVPVSRGRSLIRTGNDPVRAATRTAARAALVALGTAQALTAEVAFPARAGARFTATMIDTIKIHTKDR